MIFRIKVEENQQVWTSTITSPDDPAWLPVVRTGSTDLNGYPLPPAGESAQWLPTWVPLCDPAGTTDREDAYDRFLRGDPRSGLQDVEALGGYLFSVLLGTAWTTMTAGASVEPLRLHLELPDTAVWKQLPWELMVDNTSSPLAAFRRIVAITRIVEPVHPAGPLSIEIPIRVLFVVGRELDNQLRPGAEYIALLRQLQCTIDDGTEARGVALHARLLMETTTEDLQSAVDEFQPAVVHLISHGQIVNQESVLVLTRYDGTTRSNPRPDPVNATRLAALLRASDPAKRPQAVLVNACNTAQVGDVQVAYVAQLVREGIPLVLGMAGEVADSASRLFARQFYTALVDHQSVDIAAAEGRRAALLHFKNYSENFDWGRAVFFQAAGVEATFDRKPLQQHLLEAAETLRPKGPVREAFCGRFRWLTAIHDVCQRRIGNLAIGTDEETSTGDDRPQIGKSRLLAEVAWQCVLEGWVPVHVDQRRERSSNLMHCAVNIFELLEKTREIFDLPRRHDSEVVKMACDRLGAGTFDPGSMQSFTAARDRAIGLLQPQQAAKVSSDAILLALRLDFENLRLDVEKVAGRRKGVLLLWDQLDQEEGLEEDIVRLLRKDGLGTKASPVPVIFTYATRSSGGKKLIRAINENSDVEARSLQRFDAFESGLAVRQLLAWMKYVPTRAKRQEFEAGMAFFEQTIDGYPSKLYAFQQGIQMMVQMKVLEPFDGPRIIEKFK